MTTFKARLKAKIENKKGGEKRPKGFQFIYIIFWTDVSIVPIYPDFYRKDISSLYLSEYLRIDVSIFSFYLDIYRMDISTLCFFGYIQDGYLQSLFIWISTGWLYLSSVFLDIYMMDISSLCFYGYLYRLDISTLCFFCIYIQDGYLQTIFIWISTGWISLTFIYLDIFGMDIPSLYLS